VSRTAAKFTQADVARALRAAEQVGPGRLMVELTSDGVLRIVPTSESAGSADGKSTKPQPHDSMADWK